MDQIGNECRCNCHVTFMGKPPEWKCYCSCRSGAKIKVAEYCVHGRLEITCEWCILVVLKKKIEEHSEELKRLSYQETVHWNREHTLFECFDKIQVRINGLEDKLNTIDKVLCETRYQFITQTGDKNKPLVDYSDIQEIHRVLEEHRKQIFHHKEKKPHTCPVCLSHPIYCDFKKVNCHVCEGKGIIWG